jgi:hypothetical protein
MSTDRTTRHLCNEIFKNKQIKNPQMSNKNFIQKVFKIPTNVFQN